MKVLIIGLGLIGGSIAKSLKKHSDAIVWAYDLNNDILNDAKSMGAIDNIWDKTIGEFDLVVLCLSPRATVAFLKENVKLFAKGTVVTDVCGVKTDVVSKCENICNDFGLDFIGGHPMAGKERNGFRNSDENLFNRASYILTKTDKTSEKALNTMTKFCADVNSAKITITSPEVHDKVIAFTSQIPHILAGAYVKSPTCEQRYGFSAGSFKDVSRVATIDENLWSELFLQNSGFLIPEIDNLINSLNEYRNAIINNDFDTLFNVIKQGRIIKEKDIKETERV